MGVPLVKSHSPSEVISGWCSHWARKTMVSHDHEKLGNSKSSEKL